jgi:TonB family protein
MMESSWSVGAWLAALLHQSFALQLIVDLSLKSMVLLMMFVIIDAVTAGRIASTTRHLLWLVGLICLAMLPMIPAGMMLWGQIAQWVWQHDSQLTAQAALFELPVYASNQGLSVQFASSLLVGFYVTVSLLLISRLLRALLHLRQIRLSSLAVTDVRWTLKLDELRQKLGISRLVMLRMDRGIESPVSFGCLAPHILLPPQSSDWDEAIITDVLLHELCHIKRQDWLTTVSAYALACLFWANPLVWLAQKRLRLESENSCDAAVLRSGRADTAYAHSLLNVANSCRQARRAHQHPRHKQLLMQTMLDKHTLKVRIINVLQENKMKAPALKREIKRTAAVLFVISTAMLATLGSYQVLHAQQQPDPASRVIDAEILPLNTIQPQYPTVAAADGIEGWVQVRFTVIADGSVEESSVSIVDSQPAEVFDRSAIAAAKQLLFSPRIVAGQPVDVPNVEYGFRYFMSEASERAAQL